MVQYEDMELRADYIEIDFIHNELYACGVADSNGNMHGFPVFSQAEAHYNAREIMYNFNTQKGKISHVITTQDDGFIHGEQVKKTMSRTSNEGNTPPVSSATRITRSLFPKPRSSSTTRS